MPNKHELQMNASHGSDAQRIYNGLVFGTTTPTAAHQKTENTLTVLFDNGRDDDRTRIFDNGPSD